MKRNKIMQECRKLITNETKMRVGYANVIEHYLMDNSQPFSGGHENVCYGHGIEEDEFMGLSDEIAAGLVNLIKSDMVSFLKFALDRQNTNIADFTTLKDSDYINCVKQWYAQQADSNLR